MFSICPQKVFINKNLKSTDLRVYLSIQGFANSDGYCFPSIAKIATILGVCRRTVERSLSRLEKEKVIARSKRIKQDGGYTSNGYYLKLDPESDTTNMSQGMRQECRTPYDTDVATNYKQCNNNNFNLNTACVPAREGDKVAELGNEDVQVLSDEEKKQLHDNFKDLQNKYAYLSDFKLLATPQGVYVRPLCGIFLHPQVEDKSQIAEFLTYQLGYEIAYLNFNNRIYGESEV
ncbi:MAG: helix-turn-helix domain-containing protein [Acetobacter sp.]|nr:helix-turn-helix domain-containing protein [Acetobacter sp.]